MSDDEYKIIKYAIFGIVGVAIVFYGFQTVNNAYVANQQTIPSSVKTICNIDQIVLDSISNATINQVKNQWARVMLTEIKNSGQIQTCQMKELLSLMTDDEKKKFNLKETTCDIVNCIT